MPIHPPNRKPRRGFVQRFPALILSVLLQWAPFLGGNVASSRIGLPRIVLLFRWLAGVAALEGSLHAVSGATGLTLTQGGKGVSAARGTNGIPFLPTRVSIISNYGTAAAFSFDGLPPGLKGTAQGVVTGVPEQAGVFTVTVTGWQQWFRPELLHRI